MRFDYSLPTTSASSSSRRTPDGAINLATENNLLESNQLYHHYSSAQFQSQSPSATPYLASPVQSAPHFDKSGTANSTPSPLSTHAYTSLGNYSGASPAATFSTPEGQVNLATKPFLVSGDVSPSTTYNQPSEFAPPYDHSFYHPHTETPPGSRTGVADITTNEVADFDYTYPEHGLSPIPLASAYAMQSHEPRASFDHFQSGQNGAFFETGALGDLYLDNSQLGPLHIDIPDVSSSDRRASEATVRLSLHHEHPFETVYTNLPVDSDTWSSAAYSSPSLGSFNSSPSTQNNPSTSGTPFLGLDDSQQRYSEPLLSVAQPRTHRKSSLSSSLSSSAELPVRQRRGAISEQGYQASTSNPTHPVLEESIACQLYAEDFQVETISHQTPSTSQLEDSASTPSSFQGADSPPRSSASARKPLETTCADVKVGFVHEASSDASAQAGRSPPSKIVGNLHYHPYTRTVKMSEHEQVIQFDDAPVAQPTRRPSKRTRGSRRCYCTYVCPVQGKQCDGSVSREADMSRHMHKHKSEEEELILSGRLKPENATDFGDLKPTGAATCKGCSIPMSRKDALVRHLKKSGKACQLFYPDVVLK